ncbi:hypothetical protein H4R34_003053 [Dimargaris verticillata]|uniref:LIM-domain binding protein-domain-containing protein n=1 Tax=Dimargaris verticillata TaxID=2761393 RepID=A0A9W8B1E4_9FUNG|nr:hypothetical protein H4R34_003053 [Dimargaris verticillata]
MNNQPPHIPAQFVRQNPHHQLQTIHGLQQPMLANHPQAHMFLQQQLQAGQLFNPQTMSLNAFPGLHVPQAQGQQPGQPQPQQPPNGHQPPSQQQQQQHQQQQQGLLMSQHQPTTAANFINMMQNQSHAQLAQNQAHHPFALQAMANAHAHAQGRPGHQPTAINPTLSQHAAGLHGMPPQHPGMHALAYPMMGGVLQAQAQNPAAVSMAALNSMQAMVTAAGSTPAMPNANTIPMAKAPSTPSHHPVGAHAKVGNPPTPANAMAAARHTPGPPSAPQTARTQPTAPAPAPPVGQLPTAPPTTATVNAAAMGSTAEIGIVKVHQFITRCNKLSEKDPIESWQSLVANMFTDTCVFQYKLAYKENELSKPRDFQIPSHCIARYLYTLRQAGVFSQTLSLGNPVENVVHPYGRFLDAEGVSLVDVYKNGTRVVQDGRLSIMFSPQMKIELWQMQVEHHMELLPRVFLDTVRNSSYHPAGAPPKKSGGFKGGDKMGSNLSLVPDSPVGGYGLPDKVVRLLEVSDVTSTMQNLISYTLTNHSSPQHALQALAQQPAHGGLVGNPMNGIPYSALVNMGLNIGLNHAMLPTGETHGDQSQSANHVNGLAHASHASNGSSAALEATGAKDSPKPKKRSSSKNKQVGVGPLTVASTPMASPALSSAGVMSPISNSGTLSTSPSLLNGSAGSITTSMPPPDISKFGGVTGSLMASTLTQAMKKSPPSPGPGKKKVGSGGDGTTKTKRARTSNSSPRGRKPKVNNATATKLVNGTSPAAATMLSPTNGPLTPGPSPHINNGGNGPGAPAGMLTSSGLSMQGSPQANGQIMLLGQAGGLQIPPGQ